MALRWEGYGGGNLVMEEGTRVGGFAATFHSARLAVEDKFNMHSKLHRTHARRAARTQRLTKTPASD